MEIPGECNKCSQIYPEGVFCATCTYNPNKKEVKLVEKKKKKSKAK